MRWTDTVGLVALPDGGFTTHVDAAWMWHPDGTLLATCRQTRLAG